MYPTISTRRAVEGRSVLSLRSSHQYPLSVPTNDDVRRLPDKHRLFFSRFLRRWKHTPKLSDYQGRRTQASVLPLSKDKAKRKKQHPISIIKAIRPAKKSHRPRAHDVAPTAIHRLASRLDCSCNAQPCYSCRRILNCSPDNFRRLFRNEVSSRASSAVGRNRTEMSKAVYRRANARSFES